MSYDISLSINTGKNNVIVWETNITSNVRQTYDKAFGAKYWLDEVNGFKASEISAKVYKAFLWLTDNKAAVKSVEPPNGWGKYEDALRVLGDFSEALYEHPECEVNIYR